MIERRRYQVFLERQEPVVQLVRIQEVHHPVHVVPHILLLCRSLQRRRLVVHLSRHQMGHLTSRASPGLDASLLSRLSTGGGSALSTQLLAQGFVRGPVLPPSLLFLCTNLCPTLLSAPAP